MSSTIDYIYYILLTGRFFGVVLIGGFHQAAQRIKLVVADFTGVASDFRRWGSVQTNAYCGARILRDACGKRTGKNSIGLFK